MYPWIINCLSVTLSFQNKKKGANVPLVLTAHSKKKETKWQEWKQLCCLLWTPLCISLRQSTRGEIVCSPLRQYSGGEVGVCQSPRWYTEMESDSCQEGSGLPCPLHRKSREKRRAWRQAASVYCLMALPVYIWLTTENISPNSQGTLSQWGQNGKENGGTFFLSTLGTHKDRLYIYSTCVGAYPRPCPLSRSVAHFLHYISYSLKASCPKSLLSCL